MIINIGGIGNPCSLETIFPFLLRACNLLGLSNEIPIECNQLLEKALHYCLEKIEATEAKRKEQEKKEQAKKNRTIKVVDDKIIINGWQGLCVNCKKCHKEMEIACKREKSIEFLCRKHKKTIFKEYTNEELFDMREKQWEHTIAEVKTVSEENKRRMD